MAAARAPPSTGTIEGTVEASDLEAPLAGATVSLIGTNIGAIYDDEGRFQLAAIAPGTLPPVAFGPSCAS